MLEVLAEIGAFIVEYADLIFAIKEALAKGASKADIMKGIKASMVTASDAEMLRELGPDEPARSGAA